MNKPDLKKLLEAALFVSDKPLSLEQINATILGELSLRKPQLKTLLEDLSGDYRDSAIELVEVASGYRFQAKQEYAEQLQSLSQSKPTKYSRALLETLALIAYKQPITRGEIEVVRGVAVSSQIISGLKERGWVKVVGYKEVPGRPALLATTKTFLDYFGLTELSQLPELALPQPQG